MPPAWAASCTGACAGSGSRHGVAGSVRKCCCACQFGIDHARQGVEGLVRARDSLAAQGPSGYRLSRCRKPAGGMARRADPGRAASCRRGVVVLLRGRCGPDRRAGHDQRCPRYGLVLGWSRLVLAGPGSEPRRCQYWSSVVRRVCWGAGVGAQHVRERGPHASLAYPELLQLGRSRSGDSTHGRDTAWRPQADFSEPFPSWFCFAELQRGAGSWVWRRALAAVMRPGGPAASRRWRTRWR